MMELQYPYKNSVRLKLWTNYYNVTFRKQIIFSGSFFLFGVLIFVLALASSRDEDMSFLSITIGALGLIQAIVVRNKYTKMLSKTPEGIENTVVTYKLDKSDISYSDIEMEIRSRWSVFKGFAVYKSGISIIPGNARHHMLSLHKDNLGEENFNKCINTLKLYLNQLDIAAAHSF